MTAVGLFAGRGDVVLAMGLAFILGFWLGHVVTKAYFNFKNRNKQ